MMMRPGFKTWPHRIAMASLLAALAVAAQEKLQVKLGKSLDDGWQLSGWRGRVAAHIKAQKTKEGETASNTPENRYRDQAAALVKKLSYSWSRGAMGYTWYQMQTGSLSTTTRRKWGDIRNVEPVCPTALPPGLHSRVRRALECP